MKQKKKLVYDSTPKTGTSLHRYRPEREYIDMYVCADSWEGEIQNKEPHKCSEIAWFDIDNLPKNILPDVQLALQNISNNIHYGEYGWDIDWEE